MKRTSEEAVAILVSDVGYQNEARRMTDRELAQALLGVVWADVELGTWASRMLEEAIERLGGTNMSDDYDPTDPDTMIREIEMLNRVCREQQQYIEELREALIVALRKDYQEIKALLGQSTISQEIERHE